LVTVEDEGEVERAEEVHAYEDFAGVGEDC